MQKKCPSLGRGYGRKRICAYLFSYKRFRVNFKAKADGGADFSSEILVKHKLLANFGLSWPKRNLRYIISATSLRNISFFSYFISAPLSCESESFPPPKFRLGRCAGESRGKIDCTGRFFHTKCRHLGSRCDDSWRLVWKHIASNRFHGILLRKNFWLYNNTDFALACSRSRYEFPKMETAMPCVFSFIRMLTRWVIMKFINMSKLFCKKNIKNRIKIIFLFVKPKIRE